MASTAEHEAGILQLRGFRIPRTLLAPTKLDVIRIDLDISIIFQGGSFSVWNHKDKREFDFLLMIHISRSDII